MDILRVIAGIAKGHKLKTVKGMTTRPTSDRVKESLFNIIAQYIADRNVLDLFAGTGSLGIEALSRGAATAVFTDKSRDCCDIIRDNLIHTKLHEKGTVFNESFMENLARMYGEGRRFDIVLLDPPYNKNFIQESLRFLSKNDIISENGILIAEHHIKDMLPEHEGRLQLVNIWKYGEMALTMFKVRGHT